MSHRDESEIRADERRRIVEALRAEARVLDTVPMGYRERAKTRHALAIAAEWIENNEAKFSDLIDCPTCGGTGIDHHGSTDERGEPSAVPMPCPNCKNGKVPREYVAVDRLLGEGAVMEAACAAYVEVTENTLDDMRAALAAAVEKARELE
jgi:hypothetical protein